MSSGLLLILLDRPPPVQDSMSHEFCIHFTGSASIPRQRGLLIPTESVPEVGAKESCRASGVGARGSNPLAGYKLRNVAKFVCDNMGEVLPKVVRQQRASTLLVGN